MLATSKRHITAYPVWDRLHYHDIYIVLGAQVRCPLDIATSSESVPPLIVKRHRVCENAYMFNLPCKLFHMM